MNPHRVTSGDKELDEDPNAVAATSELEPTPVRKSDRSNGTWRCHAREKKILSRMSAL